MQLVEWLAQLLMMITSVISFLIGLYYSSFLLSMYIFIGGVLATGLVCVPDWPWYNRHKMTFLPPLPDAEKRFDAQSLFPVAART